jgi:hypothetical protein
LTTISVPVLDTLGESSRRILMDFPSFIQMTTALISLDAFSCSADKQEEELTIPMQAQWAFVPKVHNRLNANKKL